MEYRWEPIQDYTVGEPRALAQDELRALGDVWNEQRGRLENLDAFQRFNEQLKREWAVETGLIEGLYDLDRGVTEMLVKRGINASLIPHGAVKNPETIVSMIGDQEEVVNSIFHFVKGERELTTGYINELHALFTRHQDTVEAVDQDDNKVVVPLLKGKYKEQPNNPRRSDGELHEYCPPVHVASEMDRLIQMHHRHENVPPEVEAAWLHHRFTQIHPFQDGNGRVSRALATLIFIKSGWFPLVVRNRERDKYIDALEEADRGDLASLIRYFTDLQKDEFVKALSIAQEVLKSTRAEEAIEAVRRKLQRRKDSLMQEWEAARDTADLLCEKARERLQEVSDTLNRDMKGVFDHPYFHVNHALNEDSKSHFFRHQIVETAKELRYFANTQTYRSWAQLIMKNTNRSDLLILFHGIGREFQGVIGCSACWFQKIENEEGGETFDVKPVADRVFQINYKENRAQTEERFRPWLEESIVRAIELWQETVM